MAGFKRATKAESKLRMAIAGPAGSGKTWTALTLAAALADGAPVAVIDTERGSASKYADLFAFDVLELDSFDPDLYTAAIREAAGAGYACVIVDSLTHAWNGRAGLLEQVERVAKLRHGGNTFKAWGDAEIRRKESELVAALTGTPVHILATLRTKTEYVVETNDRGKATPRKVGLAPVQRDGFEYEFDIFGEMTADNELIIQKTRCPALTGQILPKPGAGLAVILSDWLRAGPAGEGATAAETLGETIARIDANWVGLRTRMRDLGITTVKGANEVCQVACEKDWGEVADSDYPRVLAEVDLRERSHREAVEAAARVPADALEHLPAGAGAH